MKKKKVFTTKLAIYIFLLVFSFYTSLMSFQNPWSRKQIDIDSSVFIYIGKAIRWFGQVPYKDIFDHKGPLLYLINFIGACFPNVYFGVYIMELVTIAISFFLIYHLAHFYTKSKVASLATVIILGLMLSRYYNGGNLTEHYALPFILAALYIFSKYILNNFPKIPKLSIWLCGVFFGCVFLLRQNMISLWLINCPLLIIYFVWKKRFKDIVSCMLLFLGGIAFISLPFIIYLAANHALKDFYSAYFIYNFGYAKASNAAIVHAFMYFWNTQIIIALLMSVTSAFSKRKDPPKLILNIMQIGYFVLNFYLIVIPGRNYDHYLIYQIPCLVYGISMAFNLAIKESTRLYSNKVSRNVITGLITIAIIGILYANGIYGSIVRTLDQNRMIVTPRTSAVSAYVKTHCDEEDTMVILGHDTRLLTYSDKKSGSKYLFPANFDLIKDFNEDDYLMQIISNKTKYITGNRFNVNSKYRTFMDEQVEAGRYRLVDELDSKNYFLYELVE